MIKLSFPIFFLMLTALLGGCASTPSPPAPPLPTPTPAEGSVCPSPSPEPREARNVYLIGPGDVISITVFDEPDISGNFRVARGGNISWAWVGNVTVAGLAAEEIEDLLEQTLARDYIWQPRVMVEIKEYHSQVVYFFGNVALPGITRLGENRSLLQNLLQAAGGPRVWGNSIITVLRSAETGGQPEKTTVSLQTLLSGNSGEDILLQNGDIITVAAEEAGGGVLVENRVYIVGAVNNPGSFPWRENQSALDVLMAAGGLTDYASGNRARLVRGTGEDEEEIRLRFGDILDGEMDKNILLLPGDLIIVPESFF